MPPSRQDDIEDLGLARIIRAEEVAGTDLDALPRLRGDPAGSAARLGAGALAVDDDITGRAAEAAYWPLVAVIRRNRAGNPGLARFLGRLRGILGEERGVIDGRAAVLGPRRLRRGSGRGYLRQRRAAHRAARQGPRQPDQQRAPSIPLYYRCKTL